MIGAVWYDCACHIDENNTRVILAPIVSANLKNWTLVYFSNVIKFEMNTEIFQHWYYESCWDY